MGLISHWDASTFLQLRQDFCKYFLIKIVQECGFHDLMLLLADWIYESFWEYRVLLLIPFEEFSRSVSFWFSRWSLKFSIVGFNGKFVFKNSFKTFEKFVKILMTCDWMKKFLNFFQGSRNFFIEHFFFWFSLLVHYSTTYMNMWEENGNDSSSRFILPLSADGTL